MRTPVKQRKGMANTRQLHVFLQPDLFDKINQLARFQNVSKGLLVEKILTDYIQKMAA